MSLQYGELRPSGWDRLTSLGHASTFQRDSRLGSVTARHSSSGRQQKFAALNRGRHVGHWPTFLVLTAIIQYDRPKLNPKIYPTKMKSLVHPWVTSLHPMCQLMSDWLYSGRSGTWVVDYVRRRSSTDVSSITTTDSCVPSDDQTSRQTTGRPVRRPDVPVPVQLGASLVEVLGLDEVRSHITVKIWLTLVRAW